MPRQTFDDHAHHMETKGSRRDSRRDSLKKKVRFRVPIGDALKVLDRKLEDLEAASDITADDLAITINAKN